MSPFLRYRSGMSAVLVALSMIFIAVQSLTAQDFYEPERRFLFQFYSGYESFVNDDAHYAVTTGGDLDYSTIGTRLVVDQVAHRHMNTIGLRLGLQEIRDRSNFRHNVYLDFATNVFIGPVYMVKSGITYEPEFKRALSPLGAFIGISAGLSHIWGTIGEVGDGGDIFFETPEGDIYPEGSTIGMRSDVLPYFSLSLGARLYFGKYNNLFATAGYQFSHAADIWHYRIVHASEEDTSYDFPDAPFARSPSAIDQDGTFFRIGVTLVAVSD